MTPTPTYTSAVERRRGYSAYIAHVTDLCRDHGIRHQLSLGRGRPVDDCDGAIHRHLSRLTRTSPARRAHYTLACLVALAGRPGPDAGTDAGPGPDADSKEATPDEGTYLNPAWYRRPNFGALLATAVRCAGFTPGRTEEALDVITRVSTDQAHRRLPALTERILRAGLTPDWPVLLDDLAQYEHQPGRVRTRWFDAYYATLDHAAKDPS
ncbi:type I-E CRISPR-associated protein Cse2/CasB [Kitasatospora phosalacinea]|uniref:Cse2 n=1 Tax=Kitasatospora phosalacinea TaxID=2065 RepID=A0A9W6UR55_9ACTN|nr:type I-E CRISPR-associated protein Cse2/CasB [Kitasatospora phosalacinea]GLW56802.1 hypothetical protein Kpho01_48130 [Kitasatospora phosalacinea]